MAPLRIALVGCGEHMFDTLAPSLRDAPANVVVAAADVSTERLVRFGRVYNVPAVYADYNEMLANERPDAVVAAVGHNEHHRIASAAMRAGANVFIEKTPCVTEREALEVAEVERETGKWTLVGFSRRFAPAFVMAREIAGRPEFGGVNMFQSQIHAAPYRDEEHFRINHVIHHLDVARMMLGEIELTDVQRVRRSEHMFGFAISFVAPNGALGSIHAGAFLDQSHPTERVEMLGNRRKLVIENFRHLRYHRPTSGDQDGFRPFDLEDGGDTLVWNQSHRFDPTSTYRGFEDSLHAFLTCAAEGRNPGPSIIDASRTMALLEDMERRLASPKRIREAAA